MNSKTENPVVEWCHGLDRLTSQAESIADDLHRHTLPVIKPNDVEGIEALASTFSRFMSKWQNVRDATRRMQHAGESLAKRGPEILGGHIQSMLDGLRTALADGPIDLPERCGVVASSWFQGTGFIDGKRVDGSPATMATGRLNDLPVEHWVRRMMPEDDFFMGERSKLVILGPMERGAALPCYPVEWVRAFTRQFREPQREEQRRREERERQQQAQAEAARRNDPEWRLRNLTERLERVEAENAELRAKLEGH